MYRYITDSVSYKTSLVLLLIGLFFYAIDCDAQDINIPVDPNFRMESGLDSSLIMLQELMDEDSTDFLIKRESHMITLMMTEYDDFYSLTKNLFLIDYNLERKGDKTSRSILRYWMGFYMSSQNLLDNALELWTGIDEDLPKYMLPDLYLNRGHVLSMMEEYDSAIYYLSKIDDLSNVSDSVIWKSKTRIANVYQNKGEFDNEVEQWLSVLSWLEDKNRIDWAIEANKMIANAFREQKNYDYSIVYLNKANDLHQSYDPDSPELYAYYVDIALIFELRGDNAKSLAYLKTAGKEMRKSKNYFSEAEISYRIAKIYFDSDQLDKANEYNTKSLRIASKYQYDELLSRAYYLAYEIDKKLGLYAKALDDYASFAEINQRFVEEEKEILRDLYQKQFQIERAEKQYKLIIASEELKDFELVQIKLEKENAESQINLLKEQQRKKEVELQNQTLLANETKNQLELSEKKYQAEQQASEIESLENERQLKQLQIEEQKAKELVDQGKIENLTKDNQIANLNLEKEIQKKNRVRWFSLFIIIILLMAGLFLRSKIRDNKILEEKNSEIAYQHREIEIKNKRLADEKSKSDSLLLNILPQETADELKSTGKALPKLYNSVSILFTDFSGFTKLTEKMDPREVLSNLELMFSRFDEISSDNDMERIKTIGDSYMCAGGIPVENDSHPVDAIRTALKFLKATDDFNREQRKLGMDEWNLRIGVNTGNVVAGVIGKRKFAYDIWGDSVNLASRAESHGVVNKINITENTYQLIKDQFDCDYRGEVDVKNIGKVKMYIVNKENGSS